MLSNRKKYNILNILVSSLQNNKQCEYFCLSTGVLTGISECCGQQKKKEQSYH